jgi:hypothetical protein
MKRGWAFGQKRTLRWLTDFGPSDANILYADTRFRIRRIRAWRCHSTRRLRNDAKCRYAFRPDADNSPNKAKTILVTPYDGGWPTPSVVTRIVSTLTQESKAKMSLGTPHDTTLAPDADRRFRKCEWKPRNVTRHDAGNTALSVARWSVVNVSLSQSNPT